MLVTANFFSFFLSKDWIFLTTLYVLVKKSSEAFQFEGNAKVKISGKGEIDASIAFIRLNAVKRRPFELLENRITQTR